MSEPIVLPARVDVAAVDDLAQALRPATARGDVHLDARRVTHLGALGLQLIISVARTARAQGHALQLVDPSDRFVSQLATLGLDETTLVEGVT